MTGEPDFPAAAGRLSPAAREALDEVVNGYRARLLAQVELDHPNGDITGIDLLRSVYAEPSAPDAVRLAAELSSIDEAINYRERLQRRANARSILLVLSAAVFAAAAAILPAAFPGLGVLNLAVAATALAGATVSVTVAVFSNARAEQNLRVAREERRLVEYEGLVRQLPPSDRVETKDGTTSFGATAEFLAGWNEIERALMTLAQYTLDNPQGKHLAFSTALKQLSYLDILTNYEVQRVRELLTIRNDLVHGELPRNYNLDETLPRVSDIVHDLHAAISRAETNAKISRGKRFVEKFLESDAARRSIPRADDRDPGRSN